MERTLGEITTMRPTGLGNMAALGYGGDGAIVVWEYPADGGKGGVFCIGSGCYDWYSEGIDTSKDPYHGNVAKFTKNAIDYLTGK